MEKIFTAKDVMIIGMINKWLKLGFSKDEIIKRLGTKYSTEVLPASKINNMFEVIYRAKENMCH